MKITLAAVFLVAQAFLHTSCMYTTGHQGSLEASTYVGAPHRIEEIYETRDGFAIKALYRNKEASQSLVVTTDKNGENGKFTNKNVVGTPIPFTRVSLRQYYDMKSNRTPNGKFPHAFVHEEKGPGGNSGMASVKILTSLEYTVTPQLPQTKPDWAARVSRAPGTILLDAAMLPIMIPLVIVAPNIDG